MHGSKWPINSARIVQGGEVLFEAAAEFEAAVGLGGGAASSRAGIVAALTEPDAGAFPYLRQCAHKTCR